MLLRGVTRRGRFEKKVLEWERQKRGWWPFAYSLLADLQGEYSEHDEPLLERVYMQMSTDVHVQKITRAKRLREVDEWLSEEIANRFETTHPVAIHDMAASNGITSLELYHRLSGGRRVVVRATDYFDRMSLVSVGPWTVIFDAKLDPWQIAGCGLVMSARTRPSLRYPINLLVWETLRTTVVPKASWIVTRYDTDDFKSHTGMKRVQLFHPLCIREADRCDDFKLGRENVFDNGSPEADVLRVMNVLTFHHFSNDQILAGIQACTTRLKPGALLLLGRSADEADGCSRASAYELSDRKLRPIWRINGGYEHEDLVDAVGDVGMRSVDRVS